MFAAMRGHTSIAQLLVDAGAELDAHDDISGWTALMQATYYGHRDNVVLLLVAGAPVQCVAPWSGGAKGQKSRVNSTLTLPIGTVPLVTPLP